MASASDWTAGGTPDRPARRRRDTARAEPPRCRRRRARATEASRGGFDRGDDPIDLRRELRSVDQLEEALRRRLERLRAHAVVDALVGFGVVTRRASGAARREPPAGIFV